ncbi:MAG TPA: tRNA 5-methoxyuridine(34)/uridine 5-oxyacetic acid(34) synthase CmoB [Candidatus Acidoferrum sp.]|nr:tRNA 5-methoxyuridine(34)/uridine 5-oxyacetic acid(34) synthase CmoB [Candidatus Acidoferrum sp.]
MVPVFQFRLDGGGEIVTTPFDYSSLRHAIAGTALSPLAAVIPEDLAAANNHGDFAKWRDALSALPDIAVRGIDLRHAVRVGNAEQATDVQREILRQTLMQLHPWRKGPFDLFGLAVDTEWRSDWKWQRVLPHLSSLAGRTVLDVGCGNGYHCWRMAGEGAVLVVGIEPMLLYVMQYWALRHFLPSPPVYVLPSSLEQLPEQLPAFDTVFSMGVLYHRRSPFEHLDLLKKKLRKGGELVLETLVIAGDEGMSLVPPDRYCRMNNVWFLPSCATLQGWLRRAGFTDVRVVDVTPTTTDEQRQTAWMTFDSLAQALDPADSSRTVEGHPAPLRATLLATL